ncbi:hypothetical protein BH10PSE6_BH10PSE6_24410 [soil metagenome]
MACFATPYGLRCAGHCLPRAPAQQRCRDSHRDRMKVGGQVILWKAMLALREEFREAVSVESFLTSTEIDAAIKSNNLIGNLPSAARYKLRAYLDEKMLRATNTEIEAVKLFVGDRLWLIYFVARAVQGRMGYLVHRSFDEGQYVDWRKDKPMTSLLSNVLEPSVVESLKSETFAGLEKAVDLLQASFLKEAGRVMSGAVSFADSLSGIRATMQVEALRMMEARSDLGAPKR